MSLRQGPRLGPDALSAALDGYDENIVAVLHRRIFAIPSVPASISGAAGDVVLE